MNPGDLLGTGTNSHYDFLKIILGTISGPEKE